MPRVRNTSASSSSNSSENTITTYHLPFLSDALSRLNLTPRPGGRHLPEPRDNSSSVYLWTLHSDEQNSSYAASVTQDLLTDPGAWHQSSQSARLEFFQAMCILFDLCRADQLPGSLTKCRALLRSEVHINLRDYLAIVKRGGNVRQELERFPSVSALRRSMKQNHKFLKLGVAKKEMLQPFLVTTYYRKY